MTEQIYDTSGECACDPFPAPAEGVACAQCEPNNALSCDEEWVLGKMRAIKEQARGLTARMNEMHSREMAALSGGIAPQDEAEWNRLSDELDRLRIQWVEWQERLEDAIERKLVFLGHREAT
ncbi:MAG: hypothetical protein FJ118_15350 [Deltaproteobacteria bacterium]|nr:hypothetical protein [Deltaproteobacteria bacterium]